MSGAGLGDRVFRYPCYLLFEFDVKARCKFLSPVGELGYLEPFRYAINGFKFAISKGR